MDQKTENKYFGPMTRSWEGYVFGMEHFSTHPDTLEEMKALNEDHWEEVIQNHSDYAFDPDYDMAAALESTSRFIWLTIRHEGALVGHIAFIVAAAMQFSGKLSASEIFFYIRKEHRGKAVAPQFIGFAIDFLRAAGISVMYLEDRSPTGSKSMMETYKRLGISPMCVRYMKDLEEDQ